MATAFQSNAFQSNAFQAAVPVTITPAAGSLVLTGFAPTVATPRLLTPAAAVLTLTGFAPTVTALAPVRLTPKSAQLTLVGQVSEVQGDRHAADYGHVVSDSLDRRARFTAADEEPEEQTRRFDNRPAYIALYAAGQVTAEEFAALLAA